MNKQEILKKLNDLYHVDDFEVIDFNFDCVIFESDTSQAFICIDEEGITVSEDWLEEPFPLDLLKDILGYYEQVSRGLTI